MQKESDKGDPLFTPYLLTPFLGTCSCFSYLFKLLNPYLKNSIPLNKQKNTKKPKNDNTFPSKDILRTAVKCRISYV